MFSYIVCVVQFLDSKFNNLEQKKTSVLYLFQIKVENKGSGADWCQNCSIFSSLSLKCNWEIILFRVPSFNLFVFLEFGAKFDFQ